MLISCERVYWVELVESYKHEFLVREKVGEFLIIKMTIISSRGSLYFSQPVSHLFIPEIFSCWINARSPLKLCKVTLRITRFGIQKFHTVLTLRLCVSYWSQYKQRLSHYTSLTHWFLMIEGLSVHCAVRTSHMKQTRFFFKQFIVDSNAIQSRHVLILRRLMSYIPGAPILDISRSHTTTQHSR